MRLRRLAGLALLALACASPGSEPAEPESPEDRERAERLAIEAEGLARLARVFYTRISNRRVDSIATYQDPSLREFFKSPEAYADYYAELVDELNRAAFEATRPTSATLEDLIMTEPGRGLAKVRFVGPNGKPLRFWRARLDREDQWERSGGRWWIIPGKL